MIKKVSWFLILVVIFLSPIYGKKTSPANLSLRDRPYFLVLLSREYILERNYDQAEKTLREALKIKPDNAYALHNLSALLKRRGREEEAKQYAEKVKEVLPLASPTEQLQMNMVLRRIPSSELEKQIQDMLKKFPNDYLVYHEAGVFYQSGEDKFARAIGYLEKAVALAPWLATDHNVLGYLYTYAGDYDKAIRHLERYAAIFPDRANPRDSLGEMYFMTGHYDEAMKEFQSALKISPYFDTASYHLIDTLSAKGQYEKAVDVALGLWERAMAEDQSTPALIALSSLYCEKGDLIKALEKAKAAVEQRSEWNDSLYHLGMVQLRSGDLNGLRCTLEKMSYNLQKLSARKPASDFGFVQSQFSLLQGRYQLALGNFETAIGLFRKIISSINIPHRSIGVRRDLAEALFASGDFKQAIQVLQQVLAVNPNHASSLYLLARVQASASDRAGALESIRRCLAVLKDGDRDSVLYKDASQLANSLNN